MTVKLLDSLPNITSMAILELLHHIWEQFYMKLVKVVTTLLKIYCTFLIIFQGLRIVYIVHSQCYSRATYVNKSCCKEKVSHNSQYHSILANRKWEDGSKDYLYVYLSWAYNMPLRNMHMYHKPTIQKKKTATTVYILQSRFILWDLRAVFRDT